MSNAAQGKDTLLLAGEHVCVQGYKSNLGGLYHSSNLALSVDGSAYPLVLADDAQHAAIDCRTCRHYDDKTTSCRSVVKCVEGCAYQRGGAFRLYLGAGR